MTSAESTATSASASTTAGEESSGGDGSSSSGDATTSGGSTGSSSGVETGSTGGGLSFEADVWPFLVLERDPPLSGRMASCNACHAGGAGGLAMPDPATALANMINVESSSSLCAGSMLVVPGDPDASCFVIFYEQRLRDSLGWVDQSETDVARAWVEGGAAP
jgi:hypothetical protein